VTLDVPEPLTLNVCGAPVGHWTEKEPVVALTGSLKLIVMTEFCATLVVPFVGEVEVTEGAASTLIVTVAVSFGVCPFVAV
jgi:hypothetical protein